MILGRHSAIPVVALLASCTLAVLAALPANAQAAGAAAAGLKPVGKLQVKAVGARRLTLAWHDRARGERRYRARLRPEPGGAPIRAGAGRNAERLVVAGLRPGTRYVYSVRPCRRKRCGPRRTGRPTATLLAPRGDAHPDPGCEIFPPGDALNRDVSTDPVDPRSDGIIDRILADGSDSLHPDFGSNRRYGIPYVVVPGAQPSVPIAFTAFGEESDPGPYPVPPGAPVEGGRRADGDRHVLVVRRPRRSGGACELFELYRAFERGGVRNRWSADSGARFDLGAPLAGQRPAGWTSADAAGLPIFPGLVTFEEVAAGEVDHAIRITFAATRRGYLAPATHWASTSCHPLRPPMGLRLRLEAGYDTSKIDGDAAVIATALKRYGAIVADNGSNFFISGSTDRRWNDRDLDQLKAIPGSAFEVVAPSGPERTDC